MEWYLKVLKEHYADFEGRARRKEYWMFFLFNVIIGFVIGGLGALIKLPIIGTLYSLAVLIPGIAVGVRRLHDIDKSGWWLLVSFIPIVGWIWLLVLLATDGTPGSNEYGVNPKEMIEEEVIIEIEE
jgi:uncharacterized membrane protein YhaH (DUF805 family)